MDNHNHKKYWAAFSSIPTINSKKWKILLNYFPNIQKAWEGSILDYKSSGLDDIFINKIIDFKNIKTPDRILESLDKYKIDIITIFDNNYPTNLKEIYTPPVVIYIKGKILKSDENSIAVVGSRKCTDYGRRTTEDIVGGIASSEVTIVSGLALGLDTEAHRTALNVRGRTIAVLANGLDSIYPTTNISLANKILENGCLISEQPIGMPPLKQNFPARNRIISGLSRGVLITEAGEKSGTLHTASFAIEQNRNIYAIPGPIYNPLSLGPNNLIKHGAKPVTCSEDILEDFGISCSNIKVIKPDNDNERLIFKILRTEPKHIDTIVQETNKKSDEISQIISMMEIKGKVKHLGGMIYTLN